jgi:NADPH:quinone reductase-like Zn-dependent oxidoreductase
MAKVICIRKNGDPSVLQVETVDVGAPEPGEVRLKQEFIGINYVETMIREVIYPQPVPTIPGFEAAGVVAAVGPGVSAFAPGDRALAPPLRRVQCYRSDMQGSPCSPPRRVGCNKLIDPLWITASRI